MDHPYDILIVGAGLAGLHCALRLTEVYPDAKIAIVEAYNYIGGRVVSYHPKGFQGVQWENGAGRIAVHHHRVLAYVKKYGLHTIPISAVQQYIPSDTGIPEADQWPRLSRTMRHLFGHLEPKALGNHTIAELFQKTTGSSKAEATDALARFPYYAETHVMRADAALHSFATSMGSSEGFVVVKEGLSSLIQHMVNELKQRKVTFLLEHRMVGLSKNGEEIYCESPKKQIISVGGKKIILALHAVALKHIPPFTRLPAIQKVVMSPLLRTYAIFPVTKGSSWFSDIPKTITDSPIRYMIPIDPSRGIIMISYTDASNTEHWMRILQKGGAKALEKAIVKEVRALFPDKNIPDPIYFKAHPWTEGCSYWAPGNYYIDEVSEQVMQPFPNRWPNIHICGESFSVYNQCWMEGAIEHADQMLERYFF